MEIFSFKNASSKDIALNIKSKQARRVLPTSLFLQAIKKLRFLESVTSIEDLSRYQSLRLEKLKGKRYGQFSIRINDQYRICFKENMGRLFEVEILDYHDEM